ncbi:LCP family protein [Micromonospora auratinigra]|uniref:Transcriptional attenuator, LytR family n=1 Tax=Micromonospora auratinigra TaxID=261654 RepID=A0A1A8ZD56_9ACTN|nr:LCP family protein [Micromonospora auratinigra]SBT41736.1 transcriptional attenuator, LytR family [Micromonospora auratinigra]
MPHAIVPSRRTGAPVVPARRRGPRWARWFLGVGAALMTLSGVALGGSQFLLHAATSKVTRQNLLGSAAASRQHRTITGAKNILLVGVDTRPHQDADQLTRSDSIILVHIPADHTRAYLVSLPRDSLVDIPAYDNGATPYRGGKNKINAAFAFGSRGLSGAAALSHGFELLALTVRDLTGITPDAGAIVDFQGFRQIVQVLGSVCLYVDETTTSIHIGHDRNGRPAAPYKINPDGTLHNKIPGVTPNIYRQGNHCLNPTEALDFVRQRDLLADNDYDYGRQRHQQQFLKAVLHRVMTDGLNSPTKLPGLLTAVGRTMTVDDGGIPLEDWAFALRGIGPDAITTIRTNGGSFNSRAVPGVGSAEILSPTSMELLRAVRHDTVAAFVQEHPSWVAPPGPDTPTD